MEKNSSRKFYQLELVKQVIRIRLYTVYYYGLENWPKYKKKI